MSEKALVLLGLAFFLGEELSSRGPPPTEGGGGPPQAPLPPNDTVSVTLPPDVIQPSPSTPVQGGLSTPFDWDRAQRENAARLDAKAQELLALGGQEPNYSTGQSIWIPDPAPVWTDASLDPFGSAAQWKSIIAGHTY